MENKSGQQQDANQDTKQSTSADLSTAKNDNPRANENLSREDRQEGDSDDVGSEITDGEDA